jgi:hypothetical protein
VSEILHRISDFLATWDFPTILEAIRKLEWGQVARSAYTWLIGVPILIFLLWTKRTKVLIAISSFFLFLLLIQRTIPPAGEMLSLHDLLIFVAGAVALIGFNFYFLFVRQ